MNVRYESFYLSLKSNVRRYECDKNFLARRNQIAPPDETSFRSTARPRIDSYPLLDVVSLRLHSFTGGEGVRGVLDLIARRKLAVPRVGDVVVSRHPVERASRDTRGPKPR